MDGRRHGEEPRSDGADPALADDVFATPDGARLTRRGRPKSDDPKQLVSLRLDRAVLDHFRAGGPGWQGRVNAALKRAAGA